jgi:tetratricopeptide (TPR) repeat protein
VRSANRPLDGSADRVHHRRMSVAADAEPYLRGEEALASGDFDAAREAFAASLERGETPEARDGLGRALWWTGDVEDALAERERAYALYRRSGDVATAARIAVWVAREYAEALGNAPASSGWLARASGLLRDEPPSAAHGWLDVTIGTLSHDPSEMRARAASAIDRARAIGDADLEASALALLGRALILSGDVDRGMTALDEAMTATTAGEVGDALVFGDVCCLVTRACEEAGEVARLMRWNEVIQRYLERHHHAPLLSFCGTCCAEMMQANGALSEAERWLVTSVEALEATGHRARCVHPVAKLAELRVLQGRLEEAERVLAGYEDEPDAIAAIAAVHRAKGEATIAKALLLRRLNLLGDSILAVPLLDALVEVDVSTRDVDAARDAARRLRAIAEASGHPRVRAFADRADGRVAVAAGQPGAVRALEAALATF